MDDVAGAGDPSPQTGTMTSARCPHCGIPHAADARTCPATGLALPQSSASGGADPRRRVAPGVIPPAPAVPGRPSAPGAAMQHRAPAAPAEEPQPRRELVGRVIGEKYGVTGLIGEGGMGAVYEAEHMTVGRLVAIKVLHPRHAQKREAVVRLQHEARAVGSIGHPNICEVFDMGQLEDGSPYVVMERLHGETLAERIQREGPVPYQQLIDIVVDVLGALSAAHDKGILHRDLKPDNVFLANGHGPTPTIKLLDFGISKAMALDEPAERLTRTGMVMGTPYYMAPEQARGDRGLDRRVDLWAVGIILYEALTTRRPFLARNYNALLVQILTVRHKPVSELMPEVPQALSLLVDKALCKMREDRYQSALEFRDRLLRFKGIMAAGGTQVFFSRPAGEGDAEALPARGGGAPRGAPSQEPWSGRERMQGRERVQVEREPLAPASQPPPSSARTLARDVPARPSQQEAERAPSRETPPPARSSTRGGRGRVAGSDTARPGTEPVETATRLEPVRAGAALPEPAAPGGAPVAAREAGAAPVGAARVPAPPSSQGGGEPAREPATLPRASGRAPPLRAPSSPPRPTPSSPPRPMSSSPPRPSSSRKPPTTGRGAHVIDSELSTPDHVAAPRGLQARGQPRSGSDTAVGASAAEPVGVRGAGERRMDAAAADPARVRVPPAPAMDPRSISESLSDEGDPAPRSVSDDAATVALVGRELTAELREREIPSAPADPDTLPPGGDDAPTYVSSSPFELDIERTIVDPPSFVTRGTRSPEAGEEDAIAAPISSDGGPPSSRTPAGRRKKKKP
jgi:hypothetical protein